MFTPRKFVAIRYYILMLTRVGYLLTVTQPPCKNKQTMSEPLKPQATMYVSVLKTQASHLRTIQGLSMT